MMDSCAGPSELHLKKELTALRNARFLRDPETCLSWRSPLSSKSLAVASGLSIQHRTRENSSSVNDTTALSPPSQSNVRQKKIYLYNWRHHSGQSSVNGLELDDDERKLSVEESTEDSLSNHRRSDTNLEVPVNIRSVRCKNLVTPVTRTCRKTKTNAAFKQRVVKNSKVSMLLDLPTSSLGDLDSFEQSDETEYCNSDYAGHVTQGVAKKNSCFSRPASPLFSVSGCGSWSYSSKLLRNTRREASSRSCTPASTGSYYKYGCQNLSNVGSWDETPASEDDLDQLDLPVRQECGLPCYSSKRTKDRGCGGCSSPSLSFILRRTGNSIFCGGQILHQKKRSVSSHKKSYLPKSSQNLPLLTNSSYRGGSSLDSESDELSSNIGELELEALSRLDGKIWSSCKSHGGLEVVRSGEADLELHNHRSLSQRYRPKSFGDIIGQSIVIHSLSHAILKGKISSAYLFHGPHGTGKTSAARIFASAMNCLSTNQNKPCGFCRECTHFASGSGSHILEVNAADNKRLDSVKYILKSTSLSTTSSRYKVVVIDQCHMLSSKLWSEFMKFLEEPFPHFVFIFITTDPINLSRAVVSRCQKYLFSKVKDVDIVNRLRKISLEENLDIDMDALDLIALNSDGSLSDAETILDQLSLLGKRISTSLVNDLVGVVSDDKLLDLLEIAMASDTAETVKRSRELMDSGVEPIALMSQLASLIMDIIAGTYCLTSSQCSSNAIVNRSLTQAELERFQQALKILSDAEKRLRFSSEGSTRFTAALLQLGSGLDTEHTKSSSNSVNSSNHSAKELKMDALEGTSFHMCCPSLTFQDSSLALVPRVNNETSSPQCCRTSCLVPNEVVSSGVLPANSQSIVGCLQNSKCIDTARGNPDIKCVKSDILDEIWKRCTEECHSKTLRQLLYAHGRLLSISEVEGVLIASLAFEDDNMKTRAERYLSTITNSIEIVLKHNVDVRIESLPKNHTNSLILVQQSPASCHSEKPGLLDNKGNSKSGNINWYSDKKREKGAPDLSRERVNYSEPKRQGTLGRCVNYLLASKGFQVASSPIIPSEGNIEAHGALEKGNKTSAMLMAPALAADEQRLESAWLQAAEKNATGIVSHMKHETSYVLPQNGATQNHNESLVSGSLKQWEDELADEFGALKVRETQGHQKKQIGTHKDHYAMSPSLLHSNNSAANFDKEKLGYESGPGCNGLFCWNARKPRRGKGTHLKSKMTDHLSLFGNCGKPKTPRSRTRR